MADGYPLNVYTPGIKNIRLDGNQIEKEDGAATDVYFSNSDHYKLSFETEPIPAQFDYLGAKIKRKVIRAGGWQEITGDSVDLYLYQPTDVVLTAEAVDENGKVISSESHRDHAK